MSKLVFRGVTLDHADLRRKEASVFVRVHMSSDLSGPVQKAMEWDEIPSCVDSANLEGFLTTDKMILEPNDKKLKDQEIEINCSRIEDFKITRKTEDEKTITRLRFTALVEQRGAIAWMENWLYAVGGAPAALSVTYHEQQEMELNEEVRATDQQRAAAMEIPASK